VGTLRSKTQTVIASKVQGYVREVRVREGDMVGAGDLLITVEDREFRAQAERDQAAVREAESGLDEVRRMLDEAHAPSRRGRPRVRCGYCGALTAWKGLIAPRSRADGSPPKSTVAAGAGARPDTLAQGPRGADASASRTPRLS
jgi:multidrug efflux pump subunit AcrA (membrane-fusion protein)